MTSGRATEVRVGTSGWQYDGWAGEPVEGVQFEAFTLEHSTRAPTVGYRVLAGRRTVFYVPDVAYIHEREAALNRADLYIGDGATMARSIRDRGAERGVEAGFAHDGIERILR